MKTLNDYRAMSYRMEIAEDKDEGGFVVFIRSARLYYLGESIESAAVNALDAKKAWLEAYYQNNDCEVILT